MILVGDLKGIIKKKIPVYLVNEYTGLLESYIIEGYEYDKLYRVYANLKGIEETHGSCCEYIDLLYTNKQRCLESQNIKEEKLAEQYRKEVNSLKELVSFMYKGDFRSDSRDSMVRRSVIKEKAEEFGIHLN